MNIQIVGYGFVGQAHALSLYPKHQTFVYDPDKGYSNWWKNADCYIICVSTPMADDGSCDMSNVYDVLESCPEDTPILIKSTISLEGWEEIQRTWPNKPITFSPEFLRANHAMEDFKNQETIYVGGGDYKFWSNLLSEALNTTVAWYDPKELILTKYFRNAFLASKVAFFNQVYDLCVATGVEPNQTLSLIAEDPRIGTSHSYVTIERGYGGHCFPKDVSAILYTADYYGEDLSILEEVKHYNQDVRGE